MLLKKMKKWSGVQLAALLLVAVFAMTVGACPDDGISAGSGNAPDTSALIAKITEAENAKKDVAVDTEARNIAVGVHWVPQAVMTTFDNAIAAAEKAKTAKTQAAVDSAVDTLDTAITAFNSAKETGSKSVIVATGLLRAIAEAHNVKGKVERNTAAANVARNSYWVTDAEMDALESAIAAAERAKNAATQAEADAAVTALESAIATFEAAMKEGTKTEGFSKEKLIELIALANAAKTGVVVNTAAANVAQGTSWVTQDKMTALESAISAAQTVVTNDITANIDTVYLALIDALEAFSDALSIGTKINFDQLNEAISIANTAKAGVVVDTVATNVEVGTYWVTQTVMNTFNSAITSAENARSATTQTAVDTAVTTLNGATTTFNGAKNQGTKVVLKSTDYGTSLSWGSTYNPLTISLVPGNTTAELNLNWLTAQSSTAGRSGYVRFIEGTKNAGYALIEKTGTAATATSSNTSIYHYVTVTGLVPGKSYQYSLSDNGTNWSEMYNYKVPATTGAWKFAVMSDAQINATTWDTNNRYTPVAGAKTANGWLETVAKIAAADVSFIVSCGDQVDSTTAGTGVAAEYTSFFAPPALKSLPLAPVLGNHDTASNVRYYYHLPNDPNPRNSDSSLMGNYYYLYNNILFVGLNTSKGNQLAAVSDASAHITRFDNIITAAKTAHAGKYDWLIVQHHKSTASVADHLADRDIQSFVEAGFEKLMSDQGVDFVLAGHDHVYARSYPLSGRDGGKVSVPDKTHNAASGSTWTGVQDPIYLTFTTASGLKYYAVSSDTAFNYSNTLYVKDNATYPYLGESTAGDGSTYFGSTQYMNYKRMPVSNAAFVQPYIPSYSVVEVNGRSITFKTYPIATASGTSSGATTPYSYDSNVPYDSITVTK